MISCAVNTTSTACLNAAMSNDPSASRNFSRLRLARLHALLSRCRYSEHGLLALIRPHDVRVVDVEDDHLGGPARLAAGLDGAGRRVGPAHERDRTARCPPTAQGFPG